MSNTTYMGTILRDLERLEKKGKALLEKIQELENEIIEKDKIITKNQEEMDELQEIFKNLVMQINQTLEAINGN